MLKGLGESKAVEKIEKQMVSRSEGKQLAENNATAGTATDDDWGAAWGVDDEPEATEAIDTTKQSQEEDDGADAWGWDDDDQAAETKEETSKSGQTEQLEDEDDAATAWGWGDEESEQPQEPEPKPQPQKAPAKKQKTETPAQDESREMVLKETYHISSMPEPVLELVLAILEDGAALTRPE